MIQKLVSFQISIDGLINLIEYKKRREKNWKSKGNQRKQFFEFDWWKTKH